jgi:hypothetical protein
MLPGDSPCFHACLRSTPGRKCRRARDFPERKRLPEEAWFLCMAQSCRWYKGRDHCAPPPCVSVVLLSVNAALWVSCSIKSTSMLMPQGLSTCLYLQLEQRCKDLWSLPSIKKVHQRKPPSPQRPLHMHHSLWSAHTQFSHFSGSRFAASFVSCTAGCCDDLRCEAHACTSTAG